jgi:hypothetical protein
MFLCSLTIQDISKQHLENYSINNIKNDNYLKNMKPLFIVAK